jgi:hypothetical protein
MDEIVDDDDVKLLAEGIWCPNCKVFEQDVEGINHKCEACGCDLDDHYDARVEIA